MTLKSRYYDRFIARRYDRELAESTDEFRRMTFERTRIDEGDTVLDLGCGTGLNQPHLAQLVGPTGTIIGVDASPEMLGHAEVRAREGGYDGQLTLIKGDARKIDELVSEPVDVVIATLFFSVVPAWREVFGRSFRVLRPGGRYGVMDNYWPRPSRRLWLLSWRYGANTRRPGFEPLRNAATDFALEYHPPNAAIQFYIAHGTKPTAANDPQADG